jgi:hypothetical protein
MAPYLIARGTIAARAAGAGLTASPDTARAADAPRGFLRAWAKFGLFARA